ncbi:MAG: hypothetical protein OFPII_19310 [Osedax symbiont Rs1]|nr:MAG: hypothetical protein OFPII_19310 [Osedax symbiont Rs1]
MINVLVIIEVKNFAALASFERIAVEIMRSHGGDMIKAFETSRGEGQSGREVHLLEFPSEQAFANYRADSRLLEHAELRDKAIQSTAVMQSSTFKYYAEFASR